MKIEVSEWRKAPKVVSGTKSIFAIGDIHGYHDRFMALLGEIEAMAGNEDEIMILGDMVDRGPDSKAVVEYLRTRAMHDGKKGNKLLRVIVGNHEEMLLACFHCPPDRLKATVEMWITHGGGKTLQSYGISWKGRKPIDVMNDLEEAMSYHALVYLGSLPFHERIDDYFFCHAGCDPVKPVAEQDNANFIWIRDAFLYPKTAWSHPFTVVHGHTPQDQPEVLDHRINVDTGVFYSGVLTAVQLKGDQLRFLQASMRS